MIKKSRFVLPLALTLALAFAGMAVAVGTDNNAFVDGKVSPKKLDKKKYKKVNLFLGVRNERPVDGSQENPASEYISIGKNVKINTNSGKTCSTLPANGSTTEQARASCPGKSYLGKGEAAVQFPGLPLIDDITVSVFHGPGKKDVFLHTYSPQLLAASPTVPGKIVKSNAGGKYGSALSVPASPETGSGMITKFNATIEKKTGFASARCKSKKTPFLREVTYKDGTTETAKLQQKCKRKGGKKK